MMLFRTPTRALRAVLCLALTTAFACSKDKTGPGSPAAKPPAAAAPAGALAKLPAEASVVGGLDVEALRKTKVWSSVLEARDADVKSKQEYEAFKAETGFDPVTSVTAVHFAAPDDADKSKEFGALVALSAPVDEKKLVAYLEKEAAKEHRTVERSQHQGKTLYAVKDGGWTVSLAFLDDKLIAVGGPAWSKKLVELASGQGNGLEKNAKMMALIGRANRKALLWVAGDVPPEKGATPLQVTIKSFAASLDLPASGFQLDATTTTNSADEGKKLADVATKQVAQLKPMAAALGLDALVASLKIQQAGADVSFGLSLNEAQLDALVGKAKMMAAQMGGPGKAGKSGGETKARAKSPAKPAKKKRHG